MNASMRLKVNGDTFFLPDPNGSVYFRNNKGSFRMEGSTIDEWIEKLIPVFNGEYTMEDLTDGLPDEYQKRIYEIAEVLYGNGFVRDVSQDKEHHLPDEVLQKYAGQIGFLDSFGGSGGYRFQTYRQSRVLAVGSGPFFVSLAAALLESGLPRLSMVITDAEPASRRRVSELEAHARLTDREVEVREIVSAGDRGIDWFEAVRSADAVLYVSRDGDKEQLRAIHHACMEQRKALLPAMFYRQAGISGPLVDPNQETENGMESAWRRLHQAAISQDPELHAPSSTAEALLANMLVFEWFKSVTEVKESDPTAKVYLLNLETMEGDWHSFLPHPLTRNLPALEWVPAMDERLFQGEEPKQANGLFPSFNRLTSRATGIFHQWEEGAFKQLPLCLCRVQAMDPLSEEAAEPLPEIVCAGMTHEEARRESGLAGVEAYIERLADRFLPKLPRRQESRGQSVNPYSPIGVGVGETAAEGVSRGLLKWLNEELRRHSQDRPPVVSQVKLKGIEDEHCRYYLQALKELQTEPVIGMGESVAGFPSVWVGVNGSWYGSVAFSRTSALRQALMTALLKVQNAEAFRMARTTEVSAIQMQAEVIQSITVPAVEQSEPRKQLQAAFQVLAWHKKRIWFADLSVEPFLKESFAGAFGVSVQEEETP